MSAAAHATIFGSAIAAEPERWMTKDQIAQALGKHIRSVERYAAHHTVFSRELASRGRNGRPVREYLVSSLPVEIRTKLEKPKLAKPQLVPAAPAKILGPLFPEPIRESEPSQRIGLSAEAQRQAQDRLSIITPLLEFPDPSLRARYTILRLKDGRQITTLDLLAEYLAETRTIDRATIWRWVKRYRDGGLAALARKPRADQGNSSFFSKYPQAALLAAAEYHKPHATAARAYDAISRDQVMLGIPADEMPTYKTVCNYLKALPAPLAILARQGQRRHNEFCAPHVARAFTDIQASSIWVADHMIHDVEVRNDCFQGVPLDAPMRVRLTAIMDMRSRKFVGCCWAAEGDSRSIATALRRAVRQYGPPKTFYCDNGRDFKKAARGAQTSRPSRESIKEAAELIVRSGALQRLGVEVQFCLPYHPQSKPIERAFGTVHGKLDALFPHYTTGNAYTRPDQTILAGAEHRKLMKAGRGGESDLIPASLFIQMAETWIEQSYNARHRHSGKGMNGRTPDEVFNEGYPLADRRKADPQILATLLHERRTAFVRRTAVTIDGRRYIAPPSSPQDAQAMYLANGRQIIVLFDPLDPDYAVAIDEQECKMADLQAERLTVHGAEAAEQVREVTQLRGRLVKASGIAISQMHQAVVKAGHKSDLQLLHEATIARAAEPAVSQRVTPAKADAPAGKQLHSEEIGDALAARIAAKGRTHGTHA